MKKYTVCVSKNGDSTLLKSTNSSGYQFCLKGLSAEDDSKGISPMEMMLSAAGGCACIDVICLLKQRGLELKELQVVVNGSRNMRETPAYFREVEMLFFAKGEVDHKKIEDTILLSLQKYCTVGRTLESFANISWSLSLNEVPGELKLLTVDKSQDTSSLLVRAKNNLDPSV